MSNTILSFGLIRRLVMVALAVALATAVWTTATTLPSTMLSGTAFAQTSSNTPLSWTAREPMPTARRDDGVAVDTTGKVYVIGGYDGNGGFLTTLELYDPTTDTWTTKTSSPIAANTMGFAQATNGKFYEVGGFNGNGEGVLNLAAEYDPATDTWASKASMPTQRFQFALAAGPNGKLYAIGGFDNNGTLNTVEEYDPATNSWTTKTPMPTSRGGVKAVTAPNGKIYVFGGLDSSETNALATVEEYDPTTDTWTTKTSMTYARWNFGATINAQENIYVVGGEDTPGVTHYTNAVEEYNPTTDTWTTKSAFPVAIHEFGMALGGDGNVYAVGGQTQDNAAVNTNYAGSTTSADTTPPTLNLPSNITQTATSSNGAVVNYTASATDDVDGNVPVTCTPSSGSTFPIGTTTVNCSATDTAGNKATGSFTVSVIYDFGNGSGGSFAPPVNSSNLNQVKAGQSVPVKFGLGGDFGLNIFASDYPTSQSINCQTGQPTDTVPTTTSSTSGLTYDSTSGQYTYTWKTAKAWSGTCRQLILKFADGTQQTVNFQFK